MTTNDPSGNQPTGPSGNLQPRDNAGWGCAWWWFIVAIIIIVIIWWAGWGWGTSGGYWFHNRGNHPYQEPNRITAPNSSAPAANNAPANGRSASAPTTAR